MQLSRLQDSSLPAPDSAFLHPQDVVNTFTHIASERFITQGPSEISIHTSNSISSLPIYRPITRYPGQGGDYGSPGWLLHTLLCFYLQPPPLLLLTLLLLTNTPTSMITTTTIITLWLLLLLFKSVVVRCFTLNSFWQLKFSRFPVNIPDISTYPKRYSYSRVFLYVYFIDLVKREILLSGSHEAKTNQATSWFIVKAALSSYKTTYHLAFRVWFWLDPVNCFLVLMCFICTSLFISSVPCILPCVEMFILIR